MTSPFDQIFATLGAPTMQQYMADSITHKPQGVGSGNAVATAVFHEGEPTLDRSTGKVVKRNGSVNVPSSLTVHADDTWTIEGVVWHVESIELPVGGIRRVRVLRWERQNTTKGIEVQ